MKIYEYMREFNGDLLGKNEPSVAPFSTHLYREYNSITNPHKAWDNTRAYMFFVRM